MEPIKKKEQIGEYPPYNTKVNNYMKMKVTVLDATMVP